MKLKAIVKNLDSVDPALRGLYSAEGGVYRLNVDEAEGLVDLQGLKAELAKERRAREHAEQAARDGKGVDRQQYEQMRRALSEAEQDLARRQGSWDKFKEALESRHAEQVKTLEQELDSLRKAYFSLIAEADLGDLLEAAGVRRELMPFVKSHLLPQISIDQSQGKPRPMAGGQELADFLAGWAATPEGMAVIAAPDSRGGGGGAPAGGGKPAGLLDRLKEARKKRDLDEVIRLETEIFNQRNELA